MERVSKHTVLQLMFLGAKYGLPLQIVNGSAEGLEVSLVPMPGAPTLSYEDVQAFNSCFFMDLNEFYLEENSEIFPLEWVLKRQLDVSVYESNVLYKSTILQV